MVVDSKNHNASVIDIAEMRRLLRDDDELLRELLQLFLDFYPQYVSDIEVAVAAYDADGIRETAHRFKGSLKQIQAMQAASSASSLEKQGRDCEPHPEMLSKFEQLVRDVTALCDEIRLLLDS